MRAANYLEEQGEITNQDGLLLPGTSEFLRKSPMKNFIAGRWSDAQGGQPHKVIDPSTGSLLATISLGTSADVDAAVKAAKKAFPGWAGKSPTERSVWLHRLADALEKKQGELSADRGHRRGKGGGECRSV